MAGAIQDVVPTAMALSDVDGLVRSLNRLVTDLEAVRAASVVPVTYKVEDLAAGADIAARAVYRAPIALTATDVRVTHESASVGVDGSNTVVFTLRNITAAADIATATITTNSTANGVTTLTISNAAIAAGDVVGIVVTQGATANLGVHSFQLAAVPTPIAAAANLTGFQLRENGVVPL